MSGAPPVACERPAIALIPMRVLPTGAVGLIRKLKSNGKIPDRPSGLLTEWQSLPPTDFGGVMQTE